MPDVLSLAPKWLNMYGEFITKNAGAVSQIETALRSLTYIIPGRGHENRAYDGGIVADIRVPLRPLSRIGTCLRVSGVQLLSMYHDSLLARTISQLPGIQKPHPTPHNRYTRFWTRKSFIYKRIALILQTIKYTELLWEMAAKRRGERVRWRVVVALEAVKAVCRLILLRLTNSRPLLTPPLPEREIDPTMLEEPVRDESEESSQSEQDGSWTMPRTGLTLPTLPNSSDISSYLLSKVLTADDIKPAKALLHRVQGQGQLAECLYIIRPLVFALAMQRWSGDEKSWRPWLLGLSIEYGARQLTKNDFQERVAGGLRGLTNLEREEMQKRGWALGWWAMRGAFYENITKSWVSGFTDKMRDKPLLGLVGGVIEDYQYLWDNYYFSTATL
ncbi:MAG: Peroxisomal membrane protein pex16 [Geoglossum simile]|nr:MAG: Peroxisomal membrane protein pex16 [Geoglossum simile]